jgi:phosphoglycolate phosphatase-like HAD superfamily hydrolase
MKALVLDFDGVVSDSAREAFIVAVRTFRELRPDARMPPADREVEQHPLFGTFMELMPLGNGAADYGAILTAAASAANLPDQVAYDAFRAELDPAWLERYVTRFYGTRSEMAAADPEGWRSLMRPYPEVLRLLRDHAEDGVDYAIATSKDSGSVEALLRDYGIDDLIPLDRVVDRRAGPRKSVHLERLSERLGVALDEMTFVDDKVSHLDSVAPLGVRCALAAWGYNGPREHRIAIERGYTVVELVGAEENLFED